MICIGQKWWEIGSRSVPRLGKRQFGVSRVPPCVERREKESPFFAPFPFEYTVFENHRKSLMQNGERSELSLPIELSSLKIPKK